MVKAKLIHHQLLVVDDVEKAKDFYGRILGLQQIKMPDPSSQAIWFGCLSNELHISPRKEIKVGPSGLSLTPLDREGREGRHVAFTMDGSMDDIAKHLEAEGVPFVKGAVGLPQLFCEDPAGNLIELNTGWIQEPIDSV